MVAENNIRLEQTQKLVMTPELIQAIHLLQFNTQELADYIQEQIVSNPVLETEEDLGEKVEKRRDETFEKEENFQDRNSREENRNEKELWSESDLLSHAGVHHRYL